MEDYSIRYVIIKSNEKINLRQFDEEKTPFEFERNGFELMYTVNYRKKQNKKKDYFLFVHPLMLRHTLCCF